MAGRKPRLLDMFCCAGGAAKGYERAGFEVVGIDIKPQPNYPYEFHQLDAMAIVRDRLNGCWHVGSSLPGMSNVCLGHFDAVHASPPCQHYSDLAKRNGNADEWPDLIPAVREKLIGFGVPYVIENVEGAPLVNPTLLCGVMFQDLRVIRHRLFETNFDVPERCPEGHPKHPLVFTHDKRKGHYGKLNQDYDFVQVTGGGNCTMANARDAMHCEWMQTKHELNEAIPPAYTEWIGYWLRGEVERLQREEVA